MANIITSSRIVFSIALLFFPTFSPAFYALYLAAGITDMIDGTVARKTGKVSEFGAKLDSIADIVFVVVCLIKLLPVISIPTWIFIWIGIVALLKIINIVSGFIMQKRFIMLHTIMNKVTGLLLFVLPLTVPFVDLKYTAILVCVVATFAAIQEGHFIRTNRFKKEDYKMKEVIKINENTWRIEDDGVRFYLFCGSEKAALIDTGMNSPDAKQIAEGLTNLPLILINTHADPDHISGNSAFGEFYMSPNEEENLHAYNGQGKILPIHEGDVIDLGDRELLIIDIPGHTPGSVGIIDKKNHVLISGDSIQDGKIFMFGPARNLNQYIESLKHLSKYEDLFDEIYPMHGTFPVHKDLIPKLIQGAQSIVDGNAQEYAKPVNVFGNEVTLYNFDYAGFLCQK